MVDRILAQNARAWPFEEARKLVERYKDGKPAKGYVLFETGYGPSGLPHIGTFGEVVRTMFVRHAFETLSDIPTRLFCFSDDMDGLRKVPENVPNRDMLAQHLGKALTSIPDPFGCHESFGHHNNAMLRGFLDSFGFEYEFQSATEWYKKGGFDQALLSVLEHYDEIMEIMLPSLREERAQSYSPFLPISPKTGRVLQVPVEPRPKDGTILFTDEDGAQGEQPVTGGRVKLQWKPDWAMHQHVLGVDYEMSGKDLIESVKLAAKISKVLGSKPPEGFNYELFLDEKGKKISKSVGNGLTVEEWLRYAPTESLSLFMFQKPRTAKKLYFDAIPKAVDEYVTYREKWRSENPAEQLENPAWHIHKGQLPAPEAKAGPVDFAMLLNLASVCNAEDKATLWGFITRYAPEATPQTAPYLDTLAGYAIAYYRDFVRPAKKYRLPEGYEKEALEEMLAHLPQWENSPEAIQTQIYEIGKKYPFADLRSWFKALYEILLGQEQGPRMGSFIALYGKEETLKLIRAALDGSLTKQAL